MTPEERAFLRALAMERGNPNAMHNIYVDDVLDKRRAEILAEINTAARALLGALSVSGEAPPKFCTKCYAPWNSDGYCPRGCGSAPPPESGSDPGNCRYDAPCSMCAPPEKGPRPHEWTREEHDSGWHCLTCGAKWNIEGTFPDCAAPPKEPRFTAPSFRSEMPPIIETPPTPEPVEGYPDPFFARESRTYLGHDAPVAPTPKEPPAPMEQHQAEIARRLKRMAAPAPEPPAETRSVEEILRRVFGALAAEPTPHVRAEMRCDIAEALRLHLRAGVPEGRSEWVLKAEADEKIAALRAERDEARERARGGGS